MKNTADMCTAERPVQAPSTVAWNQVCAPLQKDSNIHGNSLIFFVVFAEQFLSLALCCSIIICRVAAKLNTSVYQMKVK